MFILGFRIRTQFPGRSDPVFFFTVGSGFVFGGKFHPNLGCFQGSDPDQVFSWRPVTDLDPEPVSSRRPDPGVLSRILIRVNSIQIRNPAFHTIVATNVWLDFFLLSK